MPILENFENVTHVYTSICIVFCQRLGFVLFMDKAADRHEERALKLE